MTQREYALATRRVSTMPGSPRPSATRPRAANVVMLKLSAIFVQDLSRHGHRLASPERKARRAFKASNVIVEGHQETLRFQIGNDQAAHNDGRCALFLLGQFLDGQFLGGREANSNRNIEPELRLLHGVFIVHPCATDQNDIAYRSARFSARKSRISERVNMLGCAANRPAQKSQDEPSTLWMI